MNKNKQISDKKLCEAWGPAIKKMTGVDSTDKLRWMAKLAHNQQLNESTSPFNATGYLGDTTTPYSHLYNTPGVGDARLPHNGMPGTGDKFPGLVPMAMKVAAKTIGFDLVNNITLDGPTGIIPYFDFVYAGGKNPFGPAGTKDDPNPSFFQTNTTDPSKTWGEGPKNEVYGRFGTPHAFRTRIAGKDEEISKAYNDLQAALVDPKKSVELKNKLVEFKPVDKAVFNKTQLGYGEGAGIVARFIGFSRIDGGLMFQVIKADCALGEVFSEDPEKPTEVTIGDVKVKVANPRLISAVEDQIPEFSGAGQYDSNPWGGSYLDPYSVYEPMSRGTGELSYPREMSGKLMTQIVQVGTIQVSFAATYEMAQDLQVQWGIDVYKMFETKAVEELSQTMNKHILSSLFALGWKNHVDSFRSGGLNLNMNLADGRTETPAYAYPTNMGFYREVTDGVVKSYRNVSMPYTAGITNFQGLAPQGVTFYENGDGLLKRAQNQIVAASNWIAQRGRRGGATFVVVPLSVATALQLTAQYSNAPFANTISQTSGSLYPAGKFAGMDVYVDPNMAPGDTRVLIGRKGAESAQEPGLYLATYKMAESVKFIAEGTYSPKVVVKSRYALIPVGFYPELQYLTIDINMNTGWGYIAPAADGGNSGTTPSPKPKPGA